MWNFDILRFIVQENETLNTGWQHFLNLNSLRGQENTSMKSRISLQGGPARKVFEI